MSKDLKVVIWGFGAMGQGITETLLKREGVCIEAVCDTAVDFKGKTLADVDGVFSDYGNIIIDDDIDSVLNRPGDVVFIATDSYTKASFPKIKKAIEYGYNVISTAEEMAYPWANEPEIAREIDRLAQEHGVSVLGTGVNPGFVMDFLAIALTGAMTEVQSIEIERVNSLSPFGPTVMEEQGVGLNTDAFEKKLEQGQLAGHVGFRESVFMISDALDLGVDKFEQQMKPIITNVDRKSRYGEAKKGQVAGINMTAQGFVGDEKIIDMKHPQQIEPQEEGIKTGDYIKIKGNPDIDLAIKPEIDGGAGTIATCANMLPQVVHAAPGLRSMIDLPIPRVHKKVM